MNHDEFIDELAVGLDADHAVVALAEAVAATPPSDLRRRLLGDVGLRPRPQAAPAAAPELYALRVAAMADLLDELTGADWSMSAAPYTWSVHELIAHLTVIEEYTERQFGLGDSAPLPAGAVSVVDHLGMGSDTIAEMSAGDPAVTVRRWRAAAARVADHVRGTAFDPSAAVPLHSWPFDATTALVARAFEIWTHADDIRRATGRPLDVPTPAEFRTMSSTSVGGLPILLAVTGGPPMQPTRVVLTGPGGGTFDLGRGTAEDHESRHLLVADVVDYCRLVARRIDPALPGHQCEGDGELVDALLRAAQAIAI